MHILLAAATSFEIQPTIDFLLTRPIHSATPASPPVPGAAITPATHSTGQQDILRVSTLITGVGALSTAWSLMRQIDRDRPELIVQAGIAGCFTGKPHGEVFAIHDETLADLGVWEDNRFKTPFDLSLADPNQSPFTAGRLINPYQTLLTLTGLEAVSAITVNEISTSPDRIDWYRTTTSAAIESMEGGALHYIGLQEKIAFLQLRAVSNDIGVRDKSNWNIALAIRRLNDRLIGLLQLLDRNDTTILNAINITS
ncbi:MAG TPA: futalosine hydrolase [Puia sp.]|jgi:futalosine hydrolase|nr:futalosine hydrolase [Puia sp.]